MRKSPEDAIKDMVKDLYGTEDPRIARNRANRQARRQTRRTRRLRYTFQKTKGRANRG